MEQIYLDKMKKLGYNQLVCDIFDNWENVKDEILLPERKEGTGNGTIHVFLGAADSQLQKEFISYYQAVENGEDPSTGAIVVKHYFLASNVLSMLGHVCQYYYSKRQDSSDKVKTILSLLSSYPSVDGLLETTSLFKLSTGSNKLRPYFKQFDANGVFSKLIRQLLLPNSGYKISLYKNSKGEYAAFWLIGFDWQTNFEANSNKSLFTEKQMNEDFEFPRQQIFYGAPGTGKSHKIKENEEVKKANEKNLVFRTTFHPDSDYSTFVGAYKPSMKPVADKYKAVAGKDEEITYSFVPQAFLQAYAAAWNNVEDNVFLVIEEINRGNCAQIFGDLFQLLDRDEDGYSEYSIMADNDIANYLNGKDENGQDILTNKDGIKDGKLRLPKNLYIWATMNTSDQSLFPIDSAFKRRWDWKYVPINTRKEQWFVEAENAKYSWTAFLEKINDIINEKTSSEDKQLGFYFCKAKDNIIDAETFVSKVVFYLWNDVFKDYGFDGEYFADPDGGTLEFRKFFNFDGTINEKKVTAFMKNLNIEANGENSDDDESQGRGRMKVSFPDGTIFDDEKPIDVFMKTIDKVVKEYGLDVVKNAEIKFSGVNIIQEEGWHTDRFKENTQKKMDGYVLFINADNPKKKSELDKLSEKLNLGLTVEIVS